MICLDVIFWFNNNDKGAKIVCQVLVNKISFDFFGKRFKVYGAILKDII